MGWNVQKFSLPILYYLTINYLSIFIQIVYNFNLTNFDGINQHLISWWRHQMGTFSALLTTCAGNSPVTGEVPAQRPVTRSFDAFFNLRLNKQLSKQWWSRWFETPSRPLWRRCSVYKWGLVTSKRVIAREKKNNLPSMAGRVTWPMVRFTAWGMHYAIIIWLNIRLQPFPKQSWLGNRWHLWSH